MQEATWWKCNVQNLTSMGDLTTSSATALGSRSLYTADIIGQQGNDGQHWQSESQSHDAVMMSENCTHARGTLHIIIRAGGRSGDAGSEVLLTACRWIRLGGRMGIRRPHSSATCPSGEQDTPVQSEHMSLLPSQEPMIAVACAEP